MHAHTLTLIMIKSINKTMRVFLFNAYSALNAMLIIGILSG